MYSRRRSAFGLVQLRSLGGGTARHCVDQYLVLFRYYSLGNDAAIPGEPHDRLCHAFLLSLYDSSCAGVCTRRNGDRNFFMNFFPSPDLRFFYGGSGTAWRRTVPCRAVPDPV